MVRVRDVVVTVREASTGREYNTHHNRLSNPIFYLKFAPGYSAKAVVPPVSYANPSENLEEPEEDSHPIEDPAVALQRSRHGRTLKPRRDPDFDYSGSLFGSGLPFNSSNLHAFDTSFALSSVVLPSHANTDSSPLFV